jgi:hypothetical protein
MPKKLSYGAEVGTICQMAYVVEDIHQAIAWWIEKMGVGPWFLLDSFGSPEHIYRGKPNTANVTIAMSFAGSMNIELLQPLDNEPSVYRETIDKVGYGFHHFGVAQEDIEEEVARRIARGEVLAHRAQVPTGGKVAYFEGGEGAPGFVELIPVTPGMEAGFHRFWEATQDWDGKDPVRSFL